MDDVIEIALKKLESAKADVARLEQFIATYTELAGKNPVDKSGTSLSTPLVEDLPEPHASPAEVVESAKAVIREVGRPLSRSQLVKLLTNRGLILGGGDKNKNLGTVLWRSKQFENISGVGYWPVEFGRWMGQRKREEEFQLQ